MSDDGIEVHPAPSDLKTPPVSQQMVTEFWLRSGLN